MQLNQLYNNPNLNALFISIRVPRSLLFAIIIIMVTQWLVNLRKIMFDGKYI